MLAAQGVRHRDQLVRDRAVEALEVPPLRGAPQVGGLTQLQFVEDNLEDPAPAGRSMRSSSGWSCGRFRTRLRCCGGRPRCCALAAWSYR